MVLVTNNCSETNFLCPPFVAAMRSMGVSGKIISPDEREDAVATLSLLATQGYDLIIVDIFWSDMLAQVAPKIPEGALCHHRRCAQRHTGPAQERPGGHPAHERGVLPRGLARRRDGEAPRGPRRRRHRRRSVSFQAVDDFIVGFTAGVLRASPHALVLRKYSNDFSDPNKCEAIARSQIARGAGVVFNVAGICGLGTLRAAKRAGVWGVGVDTDQSGLGPHILTSVVKRYDSVMRMLFDRCATGGFPGGVTTALALGDHGAVLGRISPKVPASLRARLDALSRQIVSGELQVPGVAPD